MSIDVVVVERSMGPRGPVGPDGPAGEDGPAGATGPAGPRGGLRYMGSVADSTELGDIVAPTIADAWIAEDTGHSWVYTGSVGVGAVGGFVDIGVPAAGATPEVYTEEIEGDGTTTAWTITHSLGTNRITGLLMAPVGGDGPLTLDDDFTLKDAAIAIVDRDEVTATISPAIPNGKTWTLTLRSWGTL